MQRRFKYNNRRNEDNIDYNSMYQAYFRDLKDLGFSLYSLSIAIGLNQHSLDYLLQGYFSKPLKFEHVYKTSVLTGIPFDLSKYGNLGISKTDLVLTLEQKESTIKHKKNK
jgi:hypothetical protein